MLILSAALLILLAALLYHLITGDDLRGLPRRKLRPLLCRFLPHRRWGRHVYVVEGIYYSRCRNCGVNLEKRGRTEEWQLATRAPPHHDRLIRASADEEISLEASSVPLIRRGEASDT